MCFMLNVQCFINVELEVTGFYCLAKAIAGPCEVWMLQGIGDHFHNYHCGLQMVLSLLGHR